MYLIIKSLHLVSAMIWVSAMVFAPIIITALFKLPSKERIGIAIFFRKWYLLIGNFGIIFTWGLGLLTLILGGWMQSGWMILKLLFVLVFSALHGFFSAQFRRSVDDDNYHPGTWMYPVLIGQLIVILVIVFLVLTKPF